MARRIASVFLLLLSILHLVAATTSWNINNEKHRKSCQAHTKNPLEGCDVKRTKFVDPVGAGGNSTFKTVQSGMLFVFFQWKHGEIVRAREEMGRVLYPGETRIGV
jgi:hypothetical protein